MPFSSLLTIASSEPSTMEAPTTNCSACLRASTERNRRMLDGQINPAHHCSRAIEEWPLGNAFHPGWDVVPSQQLPSGIDHASACRQATLPRTQLGCPSGKRCGGLVEHGYATFRIRTRILLVA